MNKRVNIFVALAFFVGLTQALFQNQVGTFDWNIRNAGDLEDVLFQGQKIAFKSKDNCIGSLSVNRGLIDWSKHYSGSKTFVEIVDNRNSILKENQFLGFFVLDVTSKSLSWYDITSGVSKGSIGFNEYIFKFYTPKFSSLPAAKDVVHAIIRISNDQQDILVAVATAKTVQWYKNNELQNTYPLQGDGSYLAVESSNNNLAFVSRNEKGDQVCLHRPSASNKTCHAIDAKEIGQVAVQFFGQFAVAQTSSKSIVLPLGANQKAFDTKRGVFVEECGVYGYKDGNQYIVSKFNANKGTFDEFLTLPNSEKSSFGITCGTDVNIKSALFIIELVEGRNFKVRRADLSKNKESLNVIFERTTNYQISPIQEVFYNYEQDDNRFLIKTESLEVIFISKSYANLLWKREESLAQIKQVEYFDYYSLEDHAPNPYFEHLEERGDRIHEAIPNLIIRVKSQTERLVKGLGGLLKDFASHGVNALWSSSDDSFDIQYGLQKIIFAITEKNTVFGIDSKSGDIFWEKHIESEWNIERIIKATRHHETKEAVLYLTHKTQQKAKFVHIDPLDGKKTEEEQINFIPRRVVRISHAKQQFFILVKNNESIEIYPKAHQDRQDIVDFINGITLYWINQKEIVGYQISGLKLVPIWNFLFGEHEEIIQTASWAYDHEESSFSAVIPEDMKVIYKFIDSNNFGVLTKSTGNDNAHINLYVLNGVTGRVLTAKTQYDVDFNLPINLHYDENSIFVTYFNTKFLYYEIWVTEFFKSHIESSFTLLVEKHLFQKGPIDEEEQYNYADPSFVTFSRKYYFIPGIQSLSVIQTKRGITKKNLLIITPSGQVYSMDRGFLSSRRGEPGPDGKPAPTEPTSFMSTELPPYTPLLSYDTKKYLTYYQRFAGLKKVVSSPANFESTALVLAYGHDIVSSRVAPEKEFDMLNEDFNYLYLFGSVIIAFVALFVMKGMAASSKVLRIFNN